MTATTHRPTSAPDARGPRPFPARPAPDPWQVGAGLIMVGLFAASIWSVIALRINVASLVDSAGNAQRFMARMFPLDFPAAGEIVQMLWETMSIVLLATALCVILAVPLATLAAWNTSPSRAARTFSRFLIVLARATPDMVLAIVFFRLFGLGGLPGVLAMGLHSVGMVGKLYADSLEELPRGSNDAMQAGGAARLQGIVTGYVPNWLPHLISIGLYRVDINLRTSVLLGYVGVGGIGLALANALRSLQYQRGMALALVILLVCLAVELVSGVIRQNIRGSSGGTARRRGLRRILDTEAVRWVRHGAAEPRSSGTNRLSPPWDGARLRRFVGITAGLALVLAAFGGARIEPRALVDGLGRLPNTLAFFLPPAIHGMLPEIASGMLATIQIALASTLLGAVLAVPAGVLAARNVYPRQGLNTTFRVLIVGVRAIPDVILAIVMVVITGLGGVAGTLALAVGCIGMLGKLVADAVEETDVRVQEALRASGATRTQVFWAATVRQVLPAVISHLMYVLDNHVRAATLLGVVGAGGIGYLLLTAARVAQYDMVTTITIAILITVLAIEGLSVAVRRALR